MSDHGSSGKFVVKVDRDLLDVIPEFFTNLIEELSEILDALEKNDFKSAFRLGHSIKGAGAGYGFDELSRLGKSIEDSSVAKDKDVIIDDVNKARKYIANVNVEPVNDK